MKPLRPCSFPEKSTTFVSARGSSLGSLFAVFNDDDLRLRKRRLQALPEVLFDVPRKRCLVGIWFLVDDERRIDQHEVGKGTACTLGWTWPAGDREECRVTADDRREATAADSRSERSRRYPVRSGGPAGLAMNPCSAWSAVYPTDTRRARRRSCSAPVPCSRPGRYRVGKCSRSAQTEGSHRRSRRLPTAQTRSPPHR